MQSNSTATANSGYRESTNEITVSTSATTIRISEAESTMSRHGSTGG